MPILRLADAQAHFFVPWDGVGAPPADHVLLPYAAASARTDLFEKRAVGITLSNTENPENLRPILHRLSLIVLEFPVFRDGRAYTQAAVLREMGFRGEIRAVGQVLIDQIPFMARVGFTAFVVDDSITSAMLDATLRRFRGHYLDRFDRGAQFVPLRRQAAA